MQSVRERLTDLARHRLHSISSTSQLINNGNITCTAERKVVPCNSKICPTAVTWWTPKAFGPLSLRERGHSAEKGGVVPEKRRADVRVPPCTWAAAAAGFQGSEEVGSKNGRFSSRVCSWLRLCRGRGPRSNFPVLGGKSGARPRRVSCTDMQATSQCLRSVLASTAEE